MLFRILLIFVIAQRLSELVISRQNRIKMRSQGFTQFESNKNLSIMITLHIGWFISMLLESFYYAKSDQLIAIISLILFLMAQLLRFWVLKTLGTQWNITVMSPQSKSSSSSIVTTGPYRYIKHPNYLAIILEFATLPLVGGAIYTAIIFSILNGIVLYKRILVEEAALSQRDGYVSLMAGKARLIPRIL